MTGNPLEPFLPTYPSNRDKGVANYNGTVKKKRIGQSAEKLLIFPFDRGLRCGIIDHISKEVRRMLPVNIEGFEHYLIDKKGIVFNSRTNKYLKPRIRNGYLSVELSNSKTVKRDIHRLLMLTFKYQEGCETLQVNHKDGNKLNNDLKNLEWVTHKDNLKHALQTGLRKSLKGEAQATSKLTAEQVKEILIELNTGITQQKIASKYNVSQNTISKIKRKILWRHIEI